MARVQRCRAKPCLPKFALQCRQRSLQTLTVCLYVPCPNEGESGEKRQLVHKGRAPQRLCAARGVPAVPQRAAGPGSLPFSLPFSRGNPGFPRAARSAPSGRRARGARGGRQGAAERRGRRAGPAAALSRPSSALSRPSAAPRCRPCRQQPPAGRVGRPRLPCSGPAIPPPQRAHRSPLLPACGSAVRGRPAAKGVALPL